MYGSDSRSSASAASERRRSAWERAAAVPAERDAPPPCGASMDEGRR